jgi:hypothetical protein
MSSSPEASWKSVRGDEWWWSGNPALSGSLSQAISVFSIDNTFDGTARQLWTVLDATARQFPHLQVQCIYDPRTKDLLDQLQNQGLLRWTDVRNPCCRYAGIEFVQGSTRDLQCDLQCIPGDQSVRLKSRGGSTAVALTIALFMAGMLVVIRGGAALLREITDSYGYYRSDDLLVGAAECLAGLVCVAIAAWWHRTRAARDARAPQRRQFRSPSLSPIDGTPSDPSQ